MKRTLRLFASLLAVALVAAACGGDDDAAVSAAECEVGEVDGDLAIYNWTEYMDPELKDAFAAEYGVEVTESNYDSNEQMQPIINAGGSGYDFIVPSDYMVSIMIEAGDIQPALAATYPLSDLREAQRAFIAKEHVGNIVVTP